jgi:hypothetical protein
MKKGRGRKRVERLFNSSKEVTITNLGNTRKEAQRNTAKISKINSRGLDNPDWWRRST